MFGRLKQMVKEKTGRAQATCYPEELEGRVQYVEKWEARDKSLLKGLGDLTSIWKSNSQRGNMLAALNNIAEDCTGQTQEGANTLSTFMQERIRQEKAAHENGMQAMEKSIKTFFKAELNTMKDSISVLKKKRLTRDSAEGDYNNKQTEEKQRKFEAADNDFKAQMSATEAILAQIGELDNRHAEFISNALSAIGQTYS